MCGIIGGIISAVAHIKQGHAERDAANENAQNLWASADQEARDRLQRAATDAGDIAARGAAIAATHVAAAGGSNVSGGTTTAAVTESNINAARDEAMVKSNAAREAWGLKRQAALQGEALKKQGKNANAQGMLGAAGSIIGGIGQDIATSYTIASGGKS